MINSYYTVPKNFLTLYFEHRKAGGFIKKSPLKAHFRNGLQSCTRALWEDVASGHKYIILNGNAYHFHPYPGHLQNCPGAIKGHI